MTSDDWKGLAVLVVLAVAVAWVIWQMQQLGGP